MRTTNSCAEVRIEKHSSKNRPADTTGRQSGRSSTGCSCYGYRLDHDDFIVVIDIDAGTRCSCTSSARVREGPVKREALRESSSPNSCSKARHVRLREAAIFQCRLHAKRGPVSGTQSHHAAGASVTLTRRALTAWPEAPLQAQLRSRQSSRAADFKIVIVRQRP